MIDQPGRYPNIPFADYLADPCPDPSISRSVIRDLLNCPAKAYANHPRLNPAYVPDEDSEKFDIGTAAHALFLQGLDVATVIDADDWRKKEAKEARDAARIAGKVPLLTRQYDAVADMVEVASEALAASELKCLLANGESEQTFIWKEDETWFRIRPDWIRKDNALILDYKTAESARESDFKRSIDAYGYDIQDSLYRRGVMEVCGTIPDFVFMVQEKTPPYLCSFFRLDAMFSDMGEGKVKQGIAIWRECMASGKWPGYSSGIVSLEPPPWALAAWESKRFSFETERKCEL